MQKQWWNEKGFTLIEMMVVLMIISILILIAIPNVTKHSKSIDDKGCQAYVRMIQGQIEAFKIDNKGEAVTFPILIREGYLPEEGDKCPNGATLTLETDGTINVPKQ